MIRRYVSVGIVGAGQMGGGIAQVAAQNGISVVLMDANETGLKSSKALMEKLLEKNVEKGKMTDSDMSSTLARVTRTTKMADLSSCGFVIEAASESMEVKQRIFQELDGLMPRTSILATNTSSLSITKLASFTTRPEQVIGMHFMNPVPVMTLVEVITGLATSRGTMDATLSLCSQMKKEVAFSDDRPGFIANRLLMPYLNEAINALENGLGTRDDIDKTMRLGTNMPMGPLTLADFIGLDTCLAIMCTLHDAFGDKYKPAPLLVKYVDAGWLGKKTKQGFYKYDN